MATKKKKIWNVYEVGARYEGPLTEVEASSERSALDTAADHFGVRRDRLYAIPMSTTKTPSSSAHATKARRDARIVSSGQGGFLDPPEYPTHTHHVQTDLRRRPENRGSMSLAYAAEDAPWLDPDTKRQAKALLDKWKSNRPALDSQKVQDWIHQVLGYFKNAYAKTFEGPQRWNVSNLVYDDRDPVVNADLHAGVHLIRKYYPEFVPTQQDFARAYWGTR